MSDLYRWLFNTEIITINVLYQVKQGNNSALNMAENDFNYSNTKKLSPMSKLDIQETKLRKKQ